MCWLHWTTSKHSRNGSFNQFSVLLSSFQPATMHARKQFWSAFTSLCLSQVCMVNALFVHSLKKNIECLVSARLYECMLGRGGKKWCYLLTVICTPIFISVLFIIAYIWKQLKGPSADEWVKNCSTFAQWSTIWLWKRRQLGWTWRIIC